MSPSVHGLSSEHGAPVSGVGAQPVGASHVSSVHGLPSSQSTGVPLQTPLPQRSFEVHLVPSLQGMPSVTDTELHLPDSDSQLSVVHAFPSSQETGCPFWHLPPSQASPCVHADASASQGAPSSSVWVQPFAGSHVSTVQGFVSSQFLSGPGAHAPTLQMSPTVQTLPSASQGVPSSARWAQPFFASQVSVVHC